MALVIGTGGVDLSVGATMAIASAVLAKFVVTGSNGFGQPIAVAIVAAAFVGLLVGIFNGVVVAVAGCSHRRDAGLLVAGRGIALVITGGALVELFVAVLHDRAAGQFLGIPYILLVALLLAVVVAILVRRTGFGYRVLAIGGNLRASGLAGLPVRRTLITVYAISGVLAASPGSSPRRGSARPTRRTSASTSSSPRSPRSWSAARC